MKISRAWLQTFFDAPLPDAAVLGDALTFHVFEIDGIEEKGGDFILDVKVTANRGHDCLSHLGIAKELSAILSLPIKDDSSLCKSDLHKTDLVSVSIDTPLCHRYIAGYVRGVKVGPSPAWLVDRLAAMGQKSINNVVDATNFVMFNIGQPLHAFDASKLGQTKNQFAINVRAARDGEKLLALDEKEYALNPSILVIADANTGAAIGVAGVKGGMPAGITGATTDIIIESANFNGPTVRKAAQYMKLRTDASARFEQEISPELAAYGMRDVVALIQSIAGGTVVGLTDAYPLPVQNKPVSVTLEKINGVLGTTLADSDVSDVFTHLDFSFTHEDDTFTVTPPFERLDILIPEDLIEEVGRIIGYEKVPAVELPPLSTKLEVNPLFYAVEQRREELMAQGYSEVFTSVFTEKGERVVANKVDGVRPYLRATLVDGLREAYEKNIRNKDLLGLTEIKIFEIGTVWRNGIEETLLATADKNGVSEKYIGPSYVSEAYDNLPTSTTQCYQPFSKYPFIVRDIAMWVPVETSASEVLEIIKQNAGELLVRSEKFDEFAKDDRISYAFRLIFQSFDRTLVDEDANASMENITTALKAQGWEVR